MTKTAAQAPNLALVAMHGPPEATGLALTTGETLQPFDPIPAHILEKLPLPADEPGDGHGEYVAEYWNGINSSEGEFFGGVLRKTHHPF